MKLIFLNNISKDVYSRLVLIVCLLGLLFALCSCGDKETETENKAYSQLLNQSNSANVTTHRWFYFTQDGFKETDIPRNAPKVNPVPWTKAIRITSSAYIEGESYFAVNKLGLLQAPQTFGIQKNGIASEVKLIKNTELFSKASVADVYSINKKPVISFFTNTIFEQDVQNEQILGPHDAFLVEFNSKNYEYIPLLSKQILSEKLVPENESDVLPDFSNIDIRELILIDDTWNILFKSNQVNRTDFYAIAFSAKETITKSNMDPLTASSISINEYREISRPKPSLDLPKKIHSLLAPVPSRIAYYLNYAEENSTYTTQYENNTSDAKPIQGYALGLEHCSIAVFEDGTICFAGGLPAKQVLNNGETKAFKLPDLGPGYIYGPMALSGTTLIVAWEETSFFETGVSGFLAVDMEQVLYQSTFSGE